MKKFLHRRPSASMLVAVTALVVASSGTAIAASLVNGDSLIKKHSLSGNRLHNHTITGTQVNLNRLGKVPSAKNADHATSASTATAAVTAAGANFATNATNAANATNLNGQPASAYLPAATVQASGVKLVPVGQDVTLATSGALSLVASCTLSGGVTTVNLAVTSTVGNWLFGSGDAVQASAGTKNFDTATDSSSVGTVTTSGNRVQALAPNGGSLIGQDTVGVNWPATGNCFVDTTAIT